MERSARTNFILVAIAFMVVGAGFFAWAHAQVTGVTLPSIPGSITANVGSAPGQINVSWSSSVESSGTIEGYYVYRNGAQITTTAGTSYTDAGLQSGLYSYTVAAYDANGYQSQQSSAASVTIITDKTPPSTPGAVTISGPTTTNSYYSTVNLTIAWGASTDNVGVVGYYVYRNGTPITSSTVAFTGTSINDTVAPGTYTYTVEAYDAAQNISAHSSPVSIIVSIDSIPPSLPTGLIAQQVSANSVTLSWTSSTDPVGIAGYQIFRNGIQIASATQSPYTDGGLSTNAQYSYNVAAYDAAGNISNESEPPANVTIQPFNGPGAPIILGVMLFGTSSAQISWAAAPDPLAIQSYTLYRDSGAITTVTSTRNYLDTGLAPGIHTYNVAATDVSGAVSALSASSTIIIPQPSTATTPTTPTPTPTPVTVIATSSLTGLPGISASLGASLITQFLYYGLRDSQVTALQSLLAGNGYLLPKYATGFFGSLTLSAIEKFQCDKGVICTGGAGWGTVGPKTRAVLNALNTGTAVNISTPQTTASTSAALSELQVLEAELASLEKQFSTPTGTY